MAYGGRNRESTVLQVFKLNPLPYPVLLILSVIFIFLGTSWYFEYEETVESTEEQLSWVLKIVPIILLILVHFLSSIENPERFFTRSDRRRRTYYNQPSEGTSPWIVAAVIVLLLVMVSYQSSIIGI